MSNRHGKAITILTTASLVALSIAASFPSAAASGGLAVDFKQCANEWHAGAGICDWIGSILHKANSYYVEGDGVMQRIIVTGIDTSNPAATHTIDFQHEAMKNGVHAYDFIISPEQAFAIDNPQMHLNDTNLCGDDFTGTGITHGLCTSLTNEDETLAPAPANTSYTGDLCNADSVVQDQIGAFDAGNLLARGADVYGTGVSGASIAFTGYSGGSGHGCTEFANYELSWTGGPSTVMIVVAGHLAIGPGGYGTGLGASSVPGGPYHFRLGLIDTFSVGAEDNQIQGAQGTSGPSGCAPNCPAELTIFKHVVNTADGNKSPADFMLTLHSGTCAGPAFDVPFPGDENGTPFSVPAGTYCVNETMPDLTGLRGVYTGSFPAIAGQDCTGNGDGTGSVTVSAAGSANCTLVNTYGTREPFRLTVTKSVTNAFNGSEGPSAFTMVVCSNGTIFAPPPDATDLNLTCISFPGDASADANDTLEIGANQTFNVTELPFQGYTGSGSCSQLAIFPNGCDLVPAAGTLCSGLGQSRDEYLCAVTNQDHPANLTVSKSVNNAFGGSLHAGDFNVCVNATFTGGSASPRCAPGSATGTTYEIDAGPFNVTETPVVGYVLASTTGDCSGAAAVGGTYACTLRNNDTPDNLTVSKLVVNSSGGTLGSADFNICVNATFVGGLSSPQCAPGSATGTTYAIDANSPYNVTETPVQGYTLAISGDCADTPVTGSSYSCTFTNHDEPANLTVAKSVTNAYGGTLGSADFNVCVNATFANGAPSPQCAPGSATGTTYQIDAGAFNVTEGQVSGYQLTGTTGDCVDTAVVGGAYSCTLDNHDQSDPIVVTKLVTNTFGGALGPGDFNICVNATFANGASSPQCAPGSATGTTYWIDVNAPYGVTETAAQGYTLAMTGDCGGTTALGGSYACTFTNHDEPANLTVAKSVTNTYGGTLGSASFNVCVNATFANGAPSPQCAPGSATGTTYQIDAAPYNVTESPVDGYVLAGTAGDCADAAAVGGTYSCTLDNHDQPVNLTVTKVVNNTYGGTLGSSSFNVCVNATFANGAPSPQCAPGSATGTTYWIDAGSAFNVTETPVAGYALATSGDCADTPVTGSSYACTFTNHDEPANLTVTKLVFNNYGGTLGPASFNLCVNATFADNGLNQTRCAPGNATGTLYPIDAGWYNVTETPVTGYLGSGGCTGTAAIGAAYTCTIVNQDQPATLVVKKIVVNTHRFTNVSSDFTICVTAKFADNQVNQTRCAPGNATGTTYLIDAGWYRVSESSYSGYATNLSAACAGNATLGASLACTVTNHDVATTRTQGFWSAKTNFTLMVFNTYMGHNDSLGNATRLKLVTNASELFGGWLANISKTTGGKARSSLDHARMQLAQQLLAANLNCAAFLCDAPTLAMLQSAENAYAGSNATLITNFVTTVTDFNQGGNNNPLPPVLGPEGNGTPSLSQQYAGSWGIAYWDTT